MPTVVPNSKVVKHRFVHLVTLDAGIAQYDRNVYRANSMYDPDQTSVTGTQPLGFDEWSVFYKHYNVIGSKITAKFMPTSSSGTVGAGIVGIILTDSVASLPQPITIMEQNNSKYRIMGGANATSRATTITGFYSPKKFFGIKDIGDNRDLLGAPMDQNPPEEAYFSVYSAALTAGSDPSPVQVIVTIEYTCMYTERKTLTAS